MLSFSKVGEEIEHLQSQLGSDEERNTAILDRIGVLQRRMAAARPQAILAEKEDRRRRREAVGITCEGVKQRLQELADEERQIEAEMAELQQAMNALKHQAAQERPDLPSRLVHDLPEARVIAGKTAALVERHAKLNRKRVELLPLLEEPEGGENDDHGGE